MDKRTMKEIRKQVRSAMQSSVQKLRNDLEYANSEQNESELEKMLQGEAITNQDRTLIEEELEDVRAQSEERDKKELEWYRAYGSYINTYHNNVDAEASSYADGDTE